MAESYKDVESRIAEAISAYRDRENQNQVPKVAALAREFNVPYRRLQRRLHGIGSRSDIQRHNKKLTDAQETALKQFIDKFDDAGASVRLRSVRTYANTIISANEDNETNNPNKVGKNWARRFFKRNPEYKRKKQRPIDGARMGTTMLMMESWFDDLRRAIEVHNISVSYMISIET